MNVLAQPGSRPLSPVAVLDWIPMSPGVEVVTPLPCSATIAKVAGLEPAAAASPVATTHQKPTPEMSPDEATGTVITYSIRATGDIVVNSVSTANAIRWPIAIVASPTMIAAAVANVVTTGTTAMIVDLTMNPGKARGMATLCIIEGSGASAGILPSVANAPQVFVGMVATTPTVGAAAKAGRFSEPKPQYFN